MNENAGKYHANLIIAILLAAKVYRMQYTFLTSVKLELLPEVNIQMSCLHSRPLCTICFTLYIRFHARFQLK